MSTVVSRRTRIGSSNAPGIASALAAHPFGGVIIPFVFAVAEYASRRAQVLHATMPVNGLYDRFPHESAPASQSGDGIDLADDRVIELNVHSHVYIYGTERWAFQYGT